MNRLTLTLAALAATVALLLAGTVIPLGAATRPPVALSIVKQVDKASPSSASTPSPAAP